MTVAIGRVPAARTLHFGVCALLLGVGLLAPVPASATSIQFVGTTTGCFGAGCGTFTDIATNPTFGLTFDGIDPFDVTTAADGTASGIVLGSFTRGNVNVSSGLAPLPFTLQVAFSLPGDVSDAAVFASIAGTNPGGGGPLNVNFDNAWQTLSFSGPGGAGTFDFRVSGDPEVNKNGAATLFGEIRGVSYLTTQDVLPPQVPEPTSLVLLSSGLALAASRARRARARRRA